MVVGLTFKPLKVKKFNRLMAVIIIVSMEEAKL
jgi:hypothetical protein